MKSGKPTEVVVLGMIHSGHLESELYGLEQLEAILRAARPDLVLTEIPPDRFEAAAAEFAATGTITEPRVRAFPEYVDVLFPLQAELGFEIVPCAAWTREMADDRRAKLSELEVTQPRETAETDAGFASIEAEHQAAGMLDDPRTIHTDGYDEIVKIGTGPYDRHFNDALGLGGWSNINDAHWALCAAALDRVRGRGMRVAITFGAWHKGRLRAALAERTDCVELDANAIVREALGPGR
ncbi:hypothetical protein [Engelhardtia mirabilis]|uniref:hypothetical protein n=1 Tax=Engelhardtia mirabilis TaxID=2528011 RepID=UPI0011A21868